jgi:hypothetical protein
MSTLVRARAIDARRHDYGGRNGAEDERNR